MHELVSKYVSLSIFCNCSMLGLLAMFMVAMKPDPSWNFQIISYILKISTKKKKKKKDASGLQIEISLWCFT